ncbi:hypothetical protein Vadar_006240 [Vaccinium darrowii]|uniref:Uncharacterized protein n=1 Tax=Vaccinium darrowii TaxID=229202 RepID=A0ACB7YE63_9ERIC|nr:hypothetical protein Vadar_006240 [Vaccinium darrowii]
MEDWRIRHNSRFQLPPGLDFNTNEDDGELYREEEEPMSQSRPGSAKKYYLAIFLLSILIIMQTTVPNFQTWELRKLRLWRWQLVAIFAFYGPSLSCAVTNAILNAIQNSNARMFKGKLPHFYAVKRSFARFLSSVMVLMVWFFLIDTPLKKLGKLNTLLESITPILSGIVLSVTLWGVKTVVWEVISVKFYRRHYLEQIKEAVFADYMLRCMLNPLNDPSQMTEEREKIINVGPNRMTFCQWSLMCAADTLNDWEVWNLINHVRKGKILSKMLQPVLLRYRELKNASNLNLWNGTAMFVSEEIVKRVSRSESR